MGQDIFSRVTDKLGGTFSADSAFITFPNVVGFQGAFTADFGLLLQSLNVTYRQTVSRFYEVGRAATYLVGGRTEGQLAIQRIQGPRTISAAFYRKFGDVCQALTNALDFEIQTGCATATAGQQQGAVAFSCGFCVITQITLAVAAQDMMINESLQMMFNSFEYNTGAR